MKRSILIAEATFVAVMAFVAVRKGLGGTSDRPVSESISVTFMFGLPFILLGVLAVPFPKVRTLLFVVCALFVGTIPIGLDGIGCALGGEESCPVPVGLFATDFAAGQIAVILQWLMVAGLTKRPTKTDRSNVRPRSRGRGKK